MGDSLVHQTPNLLSIPRELRDQILNYILVQVSCISIYVDHDFLYDLVKQPYLALSITNRQLRDEAVEMFFSKNSFMSSIYRPLGNIPACHLHLMRRIDFISSPTRFLLTLCHKEADIIIHWYAEKWTIPVSKGRIKFQALRQPGLSWERQRPWRVIKEFQNLIAHGEGMNMEALNFLTRELRGNGLTK